MKKACRNGRSVCGSTKKTQRVHENTRVKRVSWFAILMLAATVSLVATAALWKPTPSISSLPVSLSNMNPLADKEGSIGETFELVTPEPDLNPAATVPVGVKAFDDHGNLYDAAGNMVFDGLYDYQYDAWNRLTKVTRAFLTKDGNDNVIYNKGSTVCRYQYDGLGRLVKREVMNCGDLDYTYEYYYDNHGRLIEERNGSGQTLKTYVWGNEYIDELIQINVYIDANGISNSGPVQSFWVLQDANFNVIGIVNETGRLVERYEYTPHGERAIYGRQVILSDTAEAAKWGNDALLTYPQLTSARLCETIPVSLCEFGWQGLRHDPVSFLIDNRGRMYSPKLARFMQRDPAGYVDGGNLYLSRRGNPVMHVDPTGLWSNEHRTITSEAAGDTFQRVTFRPAMDSTVGGKIVTQLQNHNMNVDTWYALSMPWHYNSPYVANRWNPRDEAASWRQFAKDLEYDGLYWQNIASNRAQVAALITKARTYKSMGRGVNFECRRALEIMGNLDHAYQDFFSHSQWTASAHVGTKAGEKRTPPYINSKWDGFEIWTKGYSPTPEQRESIFPSSFALTHNEAAHPTGFTEPVGNSTELDLRYRAAIAFQEQIYMNRSVESWSIQAWWEACNCWAKEKFGK